MTRSSTIKHVGWMAALLAVCVLSINAEAGSRQRNQKKSGQQKRQVEKKNNNKQRARPKQDRNKKQAERRRDSQREAGRDRKQREAKREKAQRNTDREARARRDAGRNKAQREANRKARAEREQQKQRAQREEQRQKERTAQARASKRAANERGANWSVKAQRKKLNERQATVRRQEQKLIQKKQAARQELRVAKLRFGNKVKRTNQAMYRRDQRLDARADAFRHNSPRKPVVDYRSRHGNKYHGHGVLRNHNRHVSRHNNHTNFGFHIIFGNASSFHYEYGHRRHYCCTGGYYIWRWEPPLEVIRYDDYGEPYNVVIRAGYYHRVWIPHYCRHNRHFYYRY